MTPILVAIYLAAIVAANLSLAHWGPSAALYNALLFIGLDLTTRDALHERWQDRRLWPRVFALVAAGSLLSYALALALPGGTPPQFVGRIALASAVAFGCAFLVDSTLYHLSRRPWIERVNLSNIAGATTDSFVFVALWPFGFDFRLAVTLAAAKIAGGLAWSLLPRKESRADPRSRGAHEPRGVPAAEPRGTELAAPLVSRRSRLEVGR